MSDEKKHRHPEPDFNAILDRVEAMMKSGTLEELPMAAPGAGGPVHSCRQAQVHG